jgi:hypothetical protein
MLDILVGKSEEVEEMVTPTPEVKQKKTKAKATLN